jgi:hypothetical protein
MNDGVFCAVPTTLGNWREGPFVRIAIYTTVLICGFALPGQTRPASPIAQHEQRGPVFCGRIGVHVSPMTRAFATKPGFYLIVGPSWKGEKCR